MVFCCAVDANCPGWIRLRGFIQISGAGKIRYDACDKFLRLRYDVNPADSPFPAIVFDSYCFLGGRASQLLDCQDKCKKNRG